MSSDFYSRVERVEAMQLTKENRKEFVKFAGPIDSADFKSLSIGEPVFSVRVLPSLLLRYGDYLFKYLNGYYTVKLKEDFENEGWAKEDDEEIPEYNRHNGTTL